VKSVNYEVPPTVRCVYAINFVQCDLRVRSIVRKTLSFSLLEMKYAYSLPISIFHASGFTALRHWDRGFEFRSRHWCTPAPFDDGLCMKRPCHGFISPCTNSYQNIYKSRIALEVNSDSEQARGPEPRYVQASN